ncbi:MAG: hypothetical protein IJ567_00690 [Lachnospiraceae bacterium]|nr:hypothetical protein [Lachnospiraceae bacterium]
MEQQIRMGVIMALPLILQLIGLIFAVRIDPYIRRKHRKVMLIIIAVDFSLVAQNIIGFVLDAFRTYPYERTLVGIYGYCVRPLILLLFFYIVSEKKKHTTAWALIGINTIVHLTALFSGICFSIDADDHFHRGRLATPVTL